MKKIKRTFNFIKKCVLALLVFIVVCNVLIYLGSKSYIYKNMEDVPEAQVVLIPGAAVSRDGDLSPILKDRVDTAIELYQAKRVKKILVSGDNSTISHNEVNPVRDYLLLRNIPDEDIFLDHAGFDTYSSMYRARDIFQISDVIISTQSFHLPRSVFLARSLGIEAHGISADRRRIRFKNYVREALANEKAVLNLILFRKPKYLGEVIPITGDGRKYP